MAESVIPATRLNEKLNIETRRRYISNGLAGIGWTPSFQDAIVQIEFGLNTLYTVEFYINKKMITDGSVPRRMIIGSMINTSDCHAVIIEYDAVGVKLLSWHYGGAEISANNPCPMIIYERG